MSSRFANRREAGRALAKKLRHYAFRSDVSVLALPRGGVPVGYEIAIRLQVPLEVFVVRKLGVPGHEEFAMGAIASGGACYLNEQVVNQLSLSREEIEAVIEQEKTELERRENEYSRRHFFEVRDQTVILVDDGLATGSSMRAAVDALRRQEPRKIIVAVPVTPPDTYLEFQAEVETIAIQIPSRFFAVGEWYDDFSQTTDDEVRELLQRAETNFRQSAHLAPPVL